MDADQDGEVQDDGGCEEAVLADVVDADRAAAAQCNRRVVLIHGALGAEQQLRGRQVDRKRERERER